MSLAITLSQKSYVGNGVQTAFATGFTFENNTDLVVEVAPNGGAYVTKVLGVDYNVTGAGADEPGGTVTFISGAPANLSTVRITRNTPRTQPVDLVSQFEILPETVEAALDRLERQLQEVERRLAAIEAGAVSVNLTASIVQDTFVCPEVQVARNVACAGRPTGVMLVRVQDATDGTFVHDGLGMPDFTAFATGQFTVRFVPGLVPGHNYTLSYLVYTL